MKSLFFVAFFLVISTIFATAADPIEVIVARFEPTTNFASVEALVKGYRLCMGWGQLPPDTMIVNQRTNYNVGIMVVTTIKDNVRRAQLVDYIQGNATSMKECFVNYHQDLQTLISSIYVAPSGDAITPAPAAEESFAAKYPYAIAGIAVAIVIGIIVAAVFMIQRRANMVAEEEEMLAGQQGGAVNGTHRGDANEARPSQRNMTVSGTNGGRGGAGAARGRGGRGRGGAAAPTNAPPQRRTAKSAEDAEGDPFGDNKAAASKSEEAVVYESAQHNNASADQNAYYTGTDGTSAVLMKDSPPPPGGDGEEEHQ